MVFRIGKSPHRACRNEPGPASAVDVTENDAAAPTPTNGPPASIATDQASTTAPSQRPHRPQPTQDASKGSSEDADDRLTRMNRELDKVLNSICRGC